MKYTETHEWIDVHGNIAIIGLSEKAQNELGEIVYLDLPKIGEKIKKDDTICVLESTKAAVDLYSPLSGKVVKINEELKKDPEKINKASEKDKWLYQLELEDFNEIDYYYKSLK